MLSDVKTKEKKRTNTPTSQNKPNTEPNIYELSERKENYDQPSSYNCPLRGHTHHIYIYDTD